MLSPAILADRRADPQNWPCNSTGFPEWRAGDCTCKVCTPIKTPSGAPPDIESPKYTEAKRLDDVMEEYYYESLVGQGTAGTSSGTAPVPTVEEADSPDKPYSPSEATAEEQDFFGRKMLRKMHGQNPADYTSSPNLHHPDYGGDKYEEPSPAKKQPKFD